MVVAVLTRVVAVLTTVVAVLECRRFDVSPFLLSPFRTCRRYDRYPIIALCALLPFVIQFACNRSGVNFSWIENDMVPQRDVTFSDFIVTCFVSEV